MKNRICILAAIAALSASASQMATEHYVDTAVSAAETRLNETNAATRAIVAAWEAYIGGTNVIIAITNYISGSYPLDDGKYKVYELRDGAYRLLYDSHTDITNHLAEFKAKDLEPALGELSDSVEAALADVPDKAWGRYTSAGEENEMTNAVWFSHPETVFGGGTEWKRVAVGEGSVCFLATSGNQVYTAGEEGKFYFSDWGYTNKFGFATTASFTIGIDPDSIQVDSSQIVAVGFDVTMTGVPVIWYTPAIEGTPVWEQLNNPDGSPVAGASHVVSFDTQTTPGWIYAFVNCANSPRGFFRAAVEQEGGASFFSTMPIDPQGGILCTNGIDKVGIDWNNGQPRLVPWRN